MIGFIEIPLSQISMSSWNYKGDDKKLMRKLVDNISENGFLENIIVREMGANKYEVVNGHHRLQALKKLKPETVMCYNLGAVGLAEAKRIAIETNETAFETDQIKLSELIKKIVQDFDVSDLEKTMPFSSQELIEISAFSDLEMGQDDFVEGDESFDIDDAEIEKKASTESYSDVEKIELLAKPRLVEEFNSLMSSIKRKIHPTKSPTMVDDNEAVLYILDKLP
jgi:DNA-directed RNA polymerase specialized sigma54-like protein